MTQSQTDWQTCTHSHTNNTFLNMPIILIIHVFSLEKKPLKHRNPDASANVPTTKPPWPKKKFNFWICNEKHSLQKKRSGPHWSRKTNVKTSKNKCYNLKHIKKTKEEHGTRQPTYCVFMHLFCTTQNRLHTHKPLFNTVVVSSSPRVKYCPPRLLAPHDVFAKVIAWILLKNIMVEITFKISRCKWLNNNTNHHDLLQDIQHDKGEWKCSQAYCTPCYEWHLGYKMTAEKIWD